ncbi:hypothetical protein ZIOFF_031438 [Zingiber officinale]|uniref:TLC domain-containing protein n=2 Tax=Zingiber officinale TaxID=94328 RepID=A0A8J5LA08_ZINOF|nr:hypothetical protein ZIOFF_031438 [Zingiber officinale]
MEYSMFCNYPSHSYTLCRLWICCNAVSKMIAEKAYIYRVDQLVRNYLLADPVVPYTSIIAGIFMSKMAYNATNSISSSYYKGFSSLKNIQQVEWNNRGMSSVHAVFITAMSIYLVFFSDLFANRPDGLIIFRNSSVSNFSLGISIGYFITDLTMIFWLYPSLGGIEYVLHHLLSIIAVSYAISTGEGQLYTYIVLISEATTPGINLRWFLDTAGMKNSRAYTINGVMMVVAWLVARILLFIYLFCNLYFYYDQIERMHKFGYFLTFMVPTTLFIMNVMWFRKIIRGLVKMLTKQQ